MISTNSGNATEALILNSDHETDEISSINEYFDTSFSLFSEFPPIENRIPLDEEEFLNTLELAVNDCFKIKNENSMKQIKNSRKIFEVNFYFDAINSIFKNSTPRGEREYYDIFKLDKIYSKIL